jgi:hypothetical protein
LGIKSPRGYNSNTINDTEMGFSLYVEDIITHDKEKLSTDILVELMTTGFIKEIPKEI